MKRVCAPDVTLNVSTPPTPAQIPGVKIGERGGFARGIASSGKHTPTAAPNAAFRNRLLLGVTPVIDILYLALIVEPARLKNQFLDERRDFRR